MGGAVSDWVRVVTRDKQTGEERRWAPVRREVADYVMERIYEPLMVRHGYTWEYFIEPCDPPEENLQPSHK